jgi:hypothetical protein
MKWLRALLTLGFLLAALPAATLSAATLAAKESSPCPQGSTWVDMDDPGRHPAALDRAALGIYDQDGDAQTCVRPVADPREGNLRVAYKVADPDEVASCPDDSGAVDTTKPDTMPFPLTPERIAPYDLNGDGRLCVTRSQLGEGDFMIDVSVANTPFYYLWCGGKFATIVGTPESDTIYGTTGDDIIVGLGGNDDIYGQGGNDIICGNEGEDDIISSEESQSIFFGGPDGDDISGYGTDRLYGNEGDDDLYAKGETHDLLDGGPGDDHLYGPRNDDDDDPCSTLFETKIYGGLDNDWLNGGCGHEQMWGGDGDDHLVGARGWNEARWETYLSDELWGGPGNDELYGSNVTDTDDHLDGGAGNDKLYGYYGDDFLDGGPDADELHGYYGDDILLDTGENDRLDGGPDRDLCISGGNVIFLNCEPESNH